MESFGRAVRESCELANQLRHKGICLDGDAQQQYLIICEQQCYGATVPCCLLLNADHTTSCACVSLPPLPPFLLQTGTIGDVKAAALDVSGPNTCVAVFVGGGTSIETPETAGASKLLEYMAFSATKAR